MVALVWVTATDYVCFLKCSADSSEEVLHIPQYPPYLVLHCEFSCVELSVSKPSMLSKLNNYCELSFYFGLTLLTLCYICWGSSVLASTSACVDASSLFFLLPRLLLVLPDNGSGFSSSMAGPSLVLCGRVVATTLWFCSRLLLLLPRLSLSLLSNSCSAAVSTAGGGPECQVELLALFLNMFRCNIDVLKRQI